MRRRRSKIEKKKRKTKCKEPSLLKFPRQNKTITVRRNALGHDQRLQKAYDQKTYGPSCLPGTAKTQRVKAEIKWSETGPYGKTSFI
jgi:hypothetical protein